MTTKKDYDIAIIGAGCFGSACAYHLTKLCNKRICLIGPNEPQGPRSESKNTVFASHYDTGRLTFPSGINPTSPMLATSVGKP